MANSGSSEKKDRGSEKNETAIRKRGWTPLERERNYPPSRERMAISWPGDCILAAMRDGFHRPLTGPTEVMFVRQQDW